MGSKFLAVAGKCNRWSGFVAVTGDGIGNVSEVNLQENLRDLVSLGILYLIGEWRMANGENLACLN